MSPELQRIAIAEACGWRLCNSDILPDKWWKLGRLGVPLKELPDYLNDLNAMHEAEKLLTTIEQQNKYYSEIAEITWGNEETGDRQVVFNQLCASASQRAEALLKTLNLYVS